MSVKRKLIISNLIMLAVPILAMVALTVVLGGILLIKSPEFGGLLINFVLGNIDDIEVTPELIRFFIAWIVGAVLIITATSVSITSWMSKTVLRPLKDLDEAMKHMQSGDLDYELISGDDEEIVSLCRSFESLRVKLRRDARLKQKREREQKLLLANISHDLKTPITSIKGYAQGIMDGVADTPEMRERYLKTICSKAEAMDDMVENLSLYSKLELKNMPYNLELSDIDGFCKKVCDDYFLDLHHAGMRLETNFGDMGMMVRIDREKMRRVFANIIGNAIKYRGGSGNLLRVSTFAENRGVVVEFTDNGTGISEEDAAHVFETFYRGDPARAAQVKGNGLGLSIAERVVSAHGGKIWMRPNSPSAGVSVSVYLPAASS